MIFWRLRVASVVESPQLMAMLNSFRHTKALNTVFNIMSEYNLYFNSQSLYRLDKVIILYKQKSLYNTNCIYNQKYTKCFNYTSCYTNSFQLNFQDAVENFLYNSEANLRKTYENHFTVSINSL